MKNHSLALLTGLCFLLCVSCEKEPDSIPVSAISLNNSSIEVVEGVSFSLTVTISPNDATNKKISWSSSNESVATVNNGVVTTIKAGTVSITAKSEDGGKTATCTVTVKEKTISVTSITLDKVNAEVTEGESLTLTATVSPDNASNKTVVWSSSDDKVASVKDGVVTTIKAGSVTITAKSEDGGGTASCAIVVKEIVIPVTEISFENASIDLNEYEELVLQVTVTPDNATNKKVVWSSSDESIVRVWQDGVVLGIKAGSATITAKSEDGDVSAECVVTVKEEIIVFEDKVVKRVCVLNFDQNDDGELSKAEAKNVITLKSSFFGDYADGVKSFNELQYFTSLNTIPSSAFSYCKYLKSIIIPDNVQTIRDRAFEGCSSLERIILPKTITSIGERAFNECKKLDIEDIPEKCTRIGEFAFSQTGITSVTIPDGTTTISKAVFDRCTFLEYANIPSSVTRIEEFAFSDCYSLVEAKLPDALTYLGRNAFNGTKLKEIVIPETLVSIPGGCFAGTEIEEIVIPSNIVSIGQLAFKCGYLKKVTIENPDIILDLNPFFIEVESFYGPIASEDNKLLIIDGYVRAIASYGIKEYSIPNGIVGIGASAFLGSSLESIQFPQSLEIIGDHSFAGCTSLKRVHFPDNLKSIQDGAFSDCDELKEVTIPDSVTEVGSNAFSSCKLDKLIVGKLAEFGENIGYVCFGVDVKVAMMRGKTPPKVCPYNIETLYVPKGTKTVYENSPWKSSYTKSIVEYTVE